MTEDLSPEPVAQAPELVPVVRFYGGQIEHMPEAEADALEAAGLGRRATPRDLLIAAVE